MRKIDKAMNFIMMVITAIVIAGGLGLMFSRPIM